MLRYLKKNSIFNNENRMKSITIQNCGKLYSSEIKNVKFL